MEIELVWVSETFVGKLDPFVDLVFETFVGNPFVVLVFETFVE